MPRDPYSELTTPELVALLRKAQQDLASGSVFTGGGAGDTSFSKQPQLALTERVRAIQRALSLRDPITYPPADFIGANRTVPDFS